MPYCKDCEFYSTRRPVGHSTLNNPITGQVETFAKCSFEKREKYILYDDVSLGERRDAPDTCGPEAKNFLLKKRRVIIKNSLLWFRLWQKKSIEGAPNQIYVTTHPDMKIRVEASKWMIKFARYINKRIKKEEDKAQEKELITYIKETT